jgi:hypothetical protein
MVDLACCQDNHACTRPPLVRVRLIPLRRDAHYCRCIARALVWPSQAAPVDVLACATHRAEIKALGYVIAETSLYESITTRTVKEATS